MATHQQRVEQEKTFQASLSIPDWAQGAIVATYTVFDEDSSAPYADDYRLNTEKTIILAWSKHTFQNCVKCAFGVKTEKRFTFHWVNWLKQFKHNCAGLTPRPTFANYTEA
ncbi:hypothetical protein [Vibrio alginolyticus]